MKGRERILKEKKNRERAMRFCIFEIFGDGIDAHCTYKNLYIKYKDIEIPEANKIH